MEYVLIISIDIEKTNKRVKRRTGKALTLQDKIDIGESYKIL